MPTQGICHCSLRSQQRTSQCTELMLIAKIRAVYFLNIKVIFCFSYVSKTKCKNSFISSGRIMNTIVCTVSRIGYSTISCPHQITVNIDIMVLTSKLTGKTAVKSPDILTFTIPGTSPFPSIDRIHRHIIQTAVFHGKLCSQLFHVRPVL